MMEEKRLRNHSMAALVAPRKAMTEQLRSGIRLLHNIITHHSMRSLKKLFAAMSIRTVRWRILKILLFVNGWNNLRSSLLITKRPQAKSEEEDDVDANELDILFDSTGREEYNGLAPGTILGNFTRLKSRLFYKFKPLGFQNDMPDWYFHLHRDLKNRVVRECINRGGTISKKTVGIGRKALSNMCDFFFVQDNASGYEKRCVLAVVFAAVGRGGEIAFTK